MMHAQITITAAVRAYIFPLPQSRQGTQNSDRICDPGSRALRCRFHVRMDLPAGIDRLIAFPALCVRPMICLSFRHTQTLYM